MTGREKLPPGQMDVSSPWQEVIMILGGRSGKSTLSAAMAAYEGCCTNWKPYLRTGELAWIFVISTREQQAQDIGRDMIFRNIKASPILRKLVVEDLQGKDNYLFSKSKTGVLVLETGCAITALPCSSRVGRGYATPFFILDEAAFFARESKDESTDKGIYSSLLPRQVQFGKAAKSVIITTPGEKSGLVYDRWIKRQKNEELYLCFKVPTWKIRDDIPKADFERLRKLDPDGFDREFGAEFQDALSPLLRPSDVDAVCRVENDIIPPKKDTLYVMSVDAAFRSKDRFAVTIAHVEKNPDKEEEYKIICDVCEIIEETFEKDVVDMALERIEELFFKYDTFEVRGDEHQADALEKLLDARGIPLNVTPWTAARHRACYGRLRAIIKQRRLSIPRYDELINELCGLQIKYLPNSGQYTISHKTGGHDDISDTVADAVYELMENEVMGPVGAQIL